MRYHIVRRTGIDTSNAEVDWLARSTGPDVVWSHDFRSDAEVDQFRWQGGIGNVINIASSDGNTRRITTDGITGTGCLEINIPAGGTCASGWWRPMSALAAGGNGKSTSDPAAGGSLPVRVWSPTNGVDYSSSWQKGFYGHPDYQSTYANWAGQSQVWDGHDFYIQFRAKISGNRYLTGQPDGKLMFVDAFALTHFQEIVVKSFNHQSWDAEATHIVDLYGMFGDSRGGNAGMLTDPQGNPTGGALQPGYNTATCRVGGPTTGCFYWPADEWLTFLLHVIPGRHNPGPYEPPAPDWTNDPVKAPYREHGIECWVARAGQTVYTKLYHLLDAAWIYGNETPGDFLLGYDPVAHRFSPPGYNALSPSGYMNALPAIGGAGWTQRFTQIIFSKSPIACPLA